MTDNLSTKIFSWRCPSNIAIVKYWGKKPGQIPCNSSVSMTLTTSHTEVDLELIDKKSTNEIEIEYFFEEQKNSSFEDRIRKYLKDQEDYFPFLNDFGLRMHSRNSFPHSAGIASSASAYGAIALALLDAANHFPQKRNQNDFMKEASNLARLGSGSACRSLFPGFAIWGENESISGSSNVYATQVTDIHPNFKNMHDAIVIVDSEPKKVSSSAGHSLMKDHPYAENRFAQANSRTSELLKILANGDFDAFIKITESEALTLHAMMMTSLSHYMLMKPATLEVIARIVDFRNETHIPISYTLDAGPNVHVLYPNADKHKVENFLNNDLNCNVKEIIFDEMGIGPEKISR